MIDMAWKVLDSPRFRWWFGEVVSTGCVVGVFILSDDPRVFALTIGATWGYGVQRYAVAQKHLQEKKR